MTQSAMMETAAPVTGYARLTRSLTRVVPSPVKRQSCWKVPRGAAYVTMRSYSWDCVEIEQIYTPLNSRRRGEATKLLQRICEIADERRIGLILFAESNFDQPLEGEALRAWYRKFGFRGTGDKTWMRREPRQ